MSAVGAVRIADAWLGAGFWKFGYVTNDLDRAIEHWKSGLGVEEFLTFEPTFDIVMRDGRSGTVRTRCAFSAGREITVELVEPVDGLIEPWSDPLRGATGFTAVLHHTGLLIDDLDAMKRAAAQRGLVPVLESAPGADLPFVFYQPPELGFYVEHMQAQAADAWLRDVRTRSLPPVSGVS